MRSVFLAAAAVAITAGAATAATYSFTAPGPAVAQIAGPGFTITPGAVGLLNFNARITQTAQGLGVSGNPDTQPGQIDGFPLGSAEYLSIAFSKAVRLVDLTLGRWDINDDLQIGINGGPLVKYGPGLSGDSQTFSFNLNNVTSLVVAAVGEIQSCGFLCNVDGLGNDDFTLQSFSVAPVPVPAAGLMLAGALGGIAALRRRRAA